MSHSNYSFSSTQRFMSCPHSLGKPLKSVVSDSGEKGVEVTKALEFDNDKPVVSEDKPIN